MNSDRVALPGPGEVERPVGLRSSTMASSLLDCPLYTYLSEGLMSPALVPSQMTVAGTLAMGSTTVRRPCRVSVQPPGGGSIGSQVAAGASVSSLTPCSKGSVPSASAGTMLMRAMAAGLRLPKMPGSLETSLSGQLGFQVAYFFRGHRVLDRGGAQGERHAVHAVRDDQLVLQRRDLGAGVGGAEPVDAGDDDVVPRRGGGELPVEARGRASSMRPTSRHSATPV